MTMSNYMRGLRERVGTRLLEVPAAGVVVRDDQDRVLLGRHSNDGVWVLPGGAIEPEEAPSDAAVREVFEETGLHVHLDRIFGIYGGPECTVRYANGDRTSYMIVAFEGHVVGGRLGPADGELLELCYFRVDELPDEKLAGWVPELFADLRRASDQSSFRPQSWSPDPNRTVSG